MLIIFLITDISMVGIFAGVYGNIAKYREGMLMGVHIPKSELEHPDVKELLQLYKKRNRQFYLWNMLAGIAVCLLCFTYFSIFITVWMFKFRFRNMDSHQHSFQMCIRDSRYSFWFPCQRDCDRTK